VPVFLSQPWLMALIPVALAIVPINKLLLLLVLAADVAVAILRRGFSPVSTACRTGGTRQLFPSASLLAG